MGQGSGRLNDTGNTFGGEPLTGNNATCNSAGANIAQQDCSKGRDANPTLNSAADGAVGFSFTKISNAGAALPASATLGSAANDWACTYDNVTGLMWEVKTTAGAAAARTPTPGLALKPATTAERPARPMAALAGMRFSAIPKIRPTDQYCEPLRPQ